MLKIDDQGTVTLEQEGEPLLTQVLISSGYPQPAITVSPETWLEAFNLYKDWVDSQRSESAFPTYVGWETTEMPEIPVSRPATLLPPEKPSFALRLRDFLSKLKMTK